MMRPAPSRATGIIAIVLDAVFIVAIATAVVLLLGVRPWLYVGGDWWALPRVPRIAIFAAAVGALRCRIVGRLPILAALRSEVGSSLEAERARFADPPRATRTVWRYALLAAITSLVWLTPHLRHVRQVPDVLDPIFSAWRLARFAHQAQQHPGDLFDGNIFHPSRDTLTYSDPTVLEGVAALPFIAAGADPLTVSNALFLASFPMAALAFFYASWRLTADPRAACIAGILGGLSAFKIEHYPHLELQFVWFAPLLLVALLRMLAHPSMLRGAIFGALLAGQWLASMYFGMMVLVFLAPMALLVSVAWRLRPTRPLCAAVAVATVTAAAGWSVTALPFVRSQQDRGERSREEVRSGSAVPLDYLAASTGLVTYRGRLHQSENERELFPGAVTLGLATVGAVAPMSLGTIVLVAGTALSFEGSLGLNGLMYGHLYNHVLPFRGMRVPARFAAFVGSGLILLSAYGAQRVWRLSATRRSQRVVFAGLFVAALIDLRASVPLRDYFATVPPIYADVTDHMVLAEIPMPAAASAAYMYFSTSHWARLVNGYSGYWPEPYTALKNDMQNFPNDALMAQLRQRGATHITVNCRLLADPSTCARVLAAMDEMPDVQQVSSARWEAAEVRLYKLR